MSSSVSAERSATWLLGVVTVLVVAALGLWASQRNLGTDETAAPAAASGASTRQGQIAALEERSRTRPDDASTWQQLAVAYTSEAGATGDPALYAAAASAVERSHALAPDTVETLLADANLALALHQFPRALAIGQEAIALRPDTAEVLAVLVDAYVELGRYEEAAETAQALLDRRPDLPALARASYLRELSGDLDGAVLAMQEAETAGVAVPVEAASVAVLLGDLLLQKGDLDGAQAAYERALRRSPGLAGAAVGTARLRAANGDVDGAIADLQALTDRTPSPDALFALLALQGAAGDDAGAADTAEVIRVVLQLLEASDQVVDLEFALFEADHGDTTRAVELARRAHDVRPDNVFTLDALAWSLHRDGDTAQAAELVDRALRLGTVDPLVRWHAAAILAADGQDDAARTVLREAFAVSAWGDPATRPAMLDLAADLGLDAPTPADA